MRPIYSQAARVRPRGTAAGTPTGATAATRFAARTPRRRSTPAAAASGPSPRLMAAWVRCRDGNPDCGYQRHRAPGPPLKRGLRFHCPQLEEGRDPDSPHANRRVCREEPQCGSMARTVPPPGLCTLRSAAVMIWDQALRAALCSCGASTTEGDTFVALVRSPHPARHPRASVRITRRRLAAPPLPPSPLLRAGGQCV